MNRKLVHLAVSTGILFFGLVAVAETMYLTGTDDKVLSIGKDKTTYSFSAGRPADEYQWADGLQPHIEYDYIVSSNASMNSSSKKTYGARNVFGGKSLQLGEALAGMFGCKFTMWGTDYVDIADLRWVNGSVACNNEGGVYLYGTNTLTGAAFTHTYTSSSSSPGKVRSLAFRCRMICDEPDLVINVTSGKSSTYKDDRSAIGMLILDDDAENGRGVDMTDCVAKFKVTNCGAYLVFAGEKSIHKFDALVPDAVTLQDRASLVMRPTAVQDANFGVTVESGKTAYLEVYTGDTSVDFLLPVAGDSSTTLVCGGYVNDLPENNAAKQMTFRNDWTDFKGTLVVASGTVVAETEATGLKDVPIVVKAGATFSATGVSGYNVTCEPGGNLANKMVEVPFDGTDATPVEFPEGLTLGDGILQPFRLSRPFVLPINDDVPRRIAVMRIVGGTLEPEDFRDLTEKTVSLPATRIETETEGGVQTVYVVARPAVAYTGGPTRTSTNLMIPDNWSDGQAPQDGKDYYWFSGDPICSTKESRDSGGSWRKSVTMAGESLTLAGGRLIVYSECFTQKDVRLGPGGGVYFYYTTGSNPYPGSASYPQHLAGGCTIDASATSQNPALIYLAGAACSNAVVEASISGSGVLKAYGDAPATLETPRRLRIYGDNSGFSGRLILAAQSKTTYVEICVTNAAAFGGPTPEATVNGVEMTAGTEQKSLTLKAEASMTVDDPKRGWTISKSNIRVVDGAEFVIKSPAVISYDQGFTKDGPGVLAFADLSGSTDHGTLQVDDGFLGTLSDAGFDTVTVKLMDGAGIAADASAEGTLAKKGFTAKYLTVAAGARLKATVFNAASKKALRQRFSTVLCTLPTSLGLTFTPAEMRGWIGSVTSEDAGNGLTRYTITYEPKGLLLLVR